MGHSVPFGRFIICSTVAVFRTVAEKPTTGFTVPSPVINRMLQSRGQARLSSRGRLGPEFRDPKRFVRCFHIGRWLYGPQTLC